MRQNTGLDKEAQQKIVLLYQALDECNSIIETLREENEKLRKITKEIKIKDDNCCTDLSFIRGD